MNKLDTDQEKTLEQLENSYWGNPPEGASNLIIKCHKLRAKKIEDLSIEDIRLLVGQSIGLEYLAPLAVNILKENPFEEGDFYEGDLLESLMKSRKDFWRANPNLKNELIEIFESNREVLDQELDVTESIKERILRAYNEFVLD